MFYSKCEQHIYLITRKLQLLWISKTRKKKQFGCSEQEEWRIWGAKAHGWVTLPSVLKYFIIENLNHRCANNFPAVTYFVLGALCFGVGESWRLFLGFLVSFFLAAVDITAHGNHPLLLHFVLVPEERAPCSEQEMENSLKMWHSYGSRKVDWLKLKGEKEREPANPAHTVDFCNVVPWKSSCWQTA